MTAKRRTPLLDMIGAARYVVAPVHGGNCVHCFHGVHVCDCELSDLRDAVRAYDHPAQVGEGEKP